MRFHTGILCLIGVITTVAPALGSSNSYIPSVSHPHYVTAHSSVSTMDKVYNQLLIEIERFEAVWKQQPHNHAALKRYSSQVRLLLDSLATLNMQPRQPESSGTITAESGTLPPAGEASSSGTGSTDHIEATEGAFRGGPFNNRSSAQSLAGLSDSWISGACQMVEEQLTLLDDVLTKESFDDSDFEGALGQLSATVQRIANPPRMRPPTSPKGF